MGINEQYLYSSWRVFNFCLVVSKEKIACRGILTAEDSSPRVRGCLEPAREQHYSDYSANKYSKAAIFRHAFPGPVIGDPPVVREFRIVGLVDGLSK